MQVAVHVSKKMKQERQISIYLSIYLSIYQSVLLMRTVGSLHLCETHLGDVKDLADSLHSAPPTMFYVPMHIIVLHPMLNSTPTNEHALTLSTVELSSMQL